jgi:hypothetical protein
LVADLPTAEVSLTPQQEQVNYFFVDLGKEVMRMKQLAYWKGSEATAEAVREEIAQRFGDEEAENYDPTKNCFTFNTWKAKGFHVKKGEKAIRSMTLVETRDPNAKEGDEKEVRRYPKTAYLFYIKQVEK